MPDYAELLARLKADIAVSPEEIDVVKADTIDTMDADKWVRMYILMLWDIRSDGTQSSRPCDDLLARAKLAQAVRSEDRTQAGFVVSADELNDVANQLIQNPLREDRHTLLHIIGLAGTSGYRAVVERFLTDPDSWTARLALHILCSPWYWNLTAEYLPQITEFLRQGLPPDGDESARSEAAHLAGPYLAHRAEPGLLRVLLDILANKQEPVDMREDAGRAVAQAMGYSEDVIPSHPEITDLDRFAESAIVHEAQQRLLREENQVPRIS